jgi:hypothetical protein
MSSIKLTTINYRYPITKSGHATSFASAEFVFNGDRVAFNAFSYLQTQSGKLLFAIQMKYGKMYAKNPQKIDENLIHSEYEKVQKFINDSLPGTDFVFVLIANCQVFLDHRNLPPIVSLLAFQNITFFMAKVIIID